MTTAKDDTVASKAEEYVLLGDPEKTSALPDLPKTTEPVDKQEKTIVADATARGGDSNKQDKTVEATHAATYEAALKEVGAAYRDVVGKHYPAMALVQVADLLEPEPVARK